MPRLPLHKVFLFKWSPEGWETHCTDKCTNKSKPLTLLQILASPFLSVINAPKCKTTSTKVISNWICEKKSFFHIHEFAPIDYSSNQAASRVQNDHHLFRRPSLWSSIPRSAGRRRWYWNQADTRRELGLEKSDTSVSESGPSAPELLLVLSKILIIITIIAQGRITIFNLCCELPSTFLSS